MLVSCLNSRLWLQQKTSKFSPSQCIWRLGIVCHTWYTSYSLRPTRALSISRIYMYICTLPTTSAGNLSQTHPYPAYLGLYTCTHTHTHTDAQCLLSGQHHIALCPQENLQLTAFLGMGTRVHDGKPSLFIAITTIYYLDTIQNWNILSLGHLKCSGFIRLKCHHPQGTVSPCHTEGALLRWQAQHHLWQHPQHHQCLRYGLRDSWIKQYLRWIERRLESSKFFEHLASCRSQMFLYEIIDLVHVLYNLHVLFCRM